MSKEELRKYCREEWERFLLEELDALRAILRYFSRFLDELDLVARSRLLLTLPLAGEIDYWKVITDRELKIYLPRTLKDKLEFRYYDPSHPVYSRVELGSRGVPGPCSEAPLIDFKKEPLLASDLVVIPVLGIGPGGVRLGRGGGYYDREREFLLKAKTVALLPQKLSNLEFTAEEHDLSLNYLITELGIKQIS